MNDRKKNQYFWFNCKIGFLEVICVKSDVRRMRACRVREWREANEQCGWEWHVRVCCVQSCDSVELCNLEFFIEIFERQTCQKENFNGFTCAKMNEDWIILNFSKIILFYFLICLIICCSIAILTRFPSATIFIFDSSFWFICQSKKSQSRKEN